ncbi:MULTISPECIES: HTTM domain-containing protein [Ralstonia solanacearum species complex]|uniref:HTTM domain-containing protein n=1 Tax=Ralstonia solanacearum species complex TaxID=3116862 RepID=UPI00078DDF1B|nr:HTTM domain-containing protein [Ralstonia solanacearum]BEU74285.1 hypothetical protein MAFF211271_38400 [Ralstonia pseudosolanacearum]AMP39731.1 hypothetical protein LBM2029_19265 [Ralstonia solanacearum]AXV79163.1 hypothetical protein CJO76_19550 [Ralstonia solanacearum]AXV88573.1 hypothetical protein CJO78_19835 [Ralstonia solanacearum]AXV93184.1 hypothetical protein CJO79_19535 [Ralstonia solanacearum]
MSIDTLINAWNTFFFQPVSVYPIALFRIVFGSVLMLDALYLCANARLYLGPNGYTEYRRHFRQMRGQVLSLFLYFPGTMTSVQIILGLHLAAVSMLILGFLTPASTVLAYLTTRSLVNRGQQMTNGGDSVAKIMAFLLIFTPCGQALSVDALLFGPADADDVMRAPWAQRLMQIQLCVIYFNTMYWKLKGATWRNGTAVYYACTNKMYRLFTFPSFLLRTPFVQILTWGVLALELALVPGLWIDETRYWIMGAAVLMHLAFMLFLNIHLFSFYMIASLMLFLNPGAVKWLVSLG